jgi:hypothetical protein
LIHFESSGVSGATSDPPPEDWYLLLLKRE